LKKILLLVILGVETLVASNSKWEGEILQEMLLSMSHNRSVKIYSQDKSLKAALVAIPFVHSVQKCTECDFVLAKKGVDDLCQKPIIVFSYYNYLHTPTAVGVFFWQKGRPTIRFSQKRLKKFNIQVQGELSKFVSKSD